MSYYYANGGEGRPMPWMDTEDKAIDPHNYLLGRERPSPTKDSQQEVFGRRPGDAEQLFPKYTVGEAASTGQVTVNGRTLNLWTYGQLETLSLRALRERAAAIRDAVGEANCPPMPSGHYQDLVKWIIHMQSEITNQKPQVGRGGATGVAGAVPSSLCREMEDRPVRRGAQAASASPTQAGRTYEASRDHYADLLAMQDSPSQGEVRGIVSNRKNGEGRRHIQPSNNMMNFGTSRAEDQQVDGRRYLGCDDNLMKQKKEMEAYERDPRAAALADNLRSRGSASRVAGEPVNHVSESHLATSGVFPEHQKQDQEAHVGGERRRHAAVPDRMVNVGTADPGFDESRTAGRKHLDCFGGSKFSQSDQSSAYRANWRKDASGLRGSSMIC